jgi:hypothetical protein
VGFSLHQIGSPDSQSSIGVRVPLFPPFGGTSSPDALVASAGLPVERQPDRRKVDVFVVFDGAGRAEI